MVKRNSSGFAYCTTVAEIEEEVARSGFAEVYAILFEDGSAEIMEGVEGHLVCYVSGNSKAESAALLKAAGIEF